MKIKNNKTISTLLMVVVAGLATTLMYYTCLFYKRCKDIEYATQNILLIVKIEKALNKIDKERVYSAIYMGKKDKKDIEKLKLHRDILDIELKNINNFLRETSGFSIYKSTIDNISKHLSYTRTRVDVLSLDYQNIFLKNYYIKVVKPLVNLIDKLKENLIIEDNEKLFNYFKLLKDRENLSIEKSLISFVINASAKMNHQDLLLWESLIESDIIEDITLKKIRGNIFIESIDGKYSISSKKWIEASDRKINTIRAKQSLLLSNSKKEIDSDLSNIKYEMMKYMFASIALFIILIILIYLFNNNIKNSRMLTDTLNDLEADLNAYQREEIKKVLKRNDTIAIYRFLVNAIKEPSRAKDYFLANMSHEIRTPLNGIVGFTNILKETKLNDDQKEFVHIIEESSNNLLHIVNDILDFSKVTAGKIEFEHIPFNIMEKFESAIDSYAAKAAQKNINLNLFIDPALPVEIMGDGTKISQIIINLLSNAVKFTDESGEIDISIVKGIDGANSTQNHVTVDFSVKDSGIGMTEEQQSKVFDAFSQADASTSRKFGGTGLGLTISSKFVSLMGGELRVESAVGEGTRFFFSLELEKLKESKERVISNMSDVTTAYITIPHKKGNSQNLKRYIEHIGADFKTYSYLEILNMKIKSIPDILFIDHQYIQDDKIITSLLKINAKTVLISTAEIEKCDCLVKSEVSKVLYKPINFSRTIKALNIVKLKRAKSQNLTEVRDIFSPKLFKNVSALVVEDNIINQKLIQNILANLDISVTVVGDGLEAFNERKKNDYDIIFMDIQMPIMDGVEATEEIIAYERSHDIKHIPIVALTANTIEADKQRYLLAGMDRYLRKPIDISELMEIIDEYFPIKEIRESIPLDNQTENIGSKKTNIILYKETELTAKIYEAVLNNLGYSVDMYSSADKFLEQLDSKEYKFALFDAQPFKSINSDSVLVDLIRDSGATPIAFVERDNNSNYCETLKPISHANEILNKLRKCS
jgi:signal transduction histidine kinase/CheY-like chemotaxis protein